MDDTQLRRRLREAADSHQPDRARILARVERGLAEPPRADALPPRPPRPRWVTATAVAVSVAGILALGGLAATTLHRPAEPAATTPATHPPARAVGTVDPGSNSWWAQSNVTLTAPRSLTALTVELRIAATGGVASTGHWRTLPAQDFTVSVRDEPAALVYTWTLKPGRTVPAGNHVFAGQFNHAEGARDSAADSYTITLTDDVRQHTTVRGDFTKPVAG
ncbi:hypothetical protein ACFV9D_33210 [Streptomyces sp. NPDC059875]|uniref:hypothetical protein n=1 Tax=unclassified Streptomyces TaxID=2593676 RepID=UPI00365254C0